MRLCDLSKGESFHISALNAPEQDVIVRVSDTQTMFMRCGPTVWECSYDARDDKWVALYEYKESEL